jgi:hypothetical protein
MNTETEIDVRRGATSASNAEADYLCPGRHAAQKGLPREATDWSEHGRKIHKALADSGNRTLVESLTLEERETFDRCREIEKRFVQQLFPDLGHQNPMRVFREQRLWTKIDGQWEHSGQPDVVFRAGPQALIGEYKTLPGDVPGAARNMQLRDQAVLVRGALLVDEVAVFVNQPLVTMSPELVVYSADDLKRAEQELFARVRASNDPNSKRVAGEIQCKFCRAKKLCPTYQQWAGSNLPTMLSILDVPMGNWTPDQRAIFCERLSVAQTWLDDAKQMMKDGLEKDPEYVPGWFLKPGAVLEHIKDPQECFNRFAALGGTIPQFMATVKVGKTKLREAVNEVTGAKGKALDAAIDALTDGIVEKSQNAPSLKRKEAGE